MNNAKDYYNIHSTEYVDKWDLSSSGLEKPENYYRLEIINAMIKMADVRSGDRVVEIGCGTGLVLHELLKITKPIYGTDISAEMLHRVKDSLLKDKNVSIVNSFDTSSNDVQADVFLAQNDLLNLNLPRNYFDKIISMEVLRYIDNVPKALENVKSIMRPNSVFVFTVTNFYSFSFFPVKYQLRKLFNKVNRDEELLQYFVTEGAIKKEIKKAGFKIVSFRKLNLLSFNPLVKEMAETSTKARKIVKWDALLSKIPIINQLFDTFIFAVKLDK